MFMMGDVGARKNLDANLLLSGQRMVGRLDCATGEVIFPFP